MTRRAPPSVRASAFLRDEGGATLVEFAIVISLFLLIFFGLIDFGRLAYHVVNSERAVHAAARVAVVRPPACLGVPTFVSLSGSAPAGTDYGTKCSAGANICQAPATITCTGSAANPTAAEVWTQARVVLPPNSTIANLRFTYSYDPRLSFLGGPYVPVVTVALEGVDFDFVTPLSALARLAGAAPGGPSPGSSIPMPAISVSLPGEDLAHGGNG
ncbi:TadE/TadG family type IV pilus assembly protein [Tabrizicola sp. YIM 78059]|uniref:TadE/TadG family type IV pilus assembly protein n=1 Tax=Tabrizicola sp. YIM 78059 TaxID=2529861 RepID=UPI0010AADE69|nr:TadE/TadG family type IV pilus assembly protein [Tabrizicola sp. YIM 78059]